MRGSVVCGLFFAAAVAILPARALAATACTAWVDIEEKGDCKQYVQDQIKRTNLKVASSGDTFFFWFGVNVVTARCIDSKSIVALAAYHYRNGACPLLEPIQNALK